MQQAIAAVHVVTGLLALLCGLLVFLRAKGTRSHRVIGYVYVASMLALNVTAFQIYRLFGRFGPFHIAALISLATVVAGMIPVLRRRPKQRGVSLHYGYMAWSYVGLVAATVAEIAVRVPWLRPHSPTVFLRSSPRRHSSSWRAAVGWSAAWKEEPFHPSNPRRQRRRDNRRWSGPRRRYSRFKTERRACAAAAAQRPYVRRSNAFLHFRLVGRGRHGDGSSLPAALRVHQASAAGRLGARA